METISLSTARTKVQRYLSLTPEQKDSYIDLFSKMEKTLKITDIETNKMDVNILPILTIVEPNKTYQVEAVKIQIPTKYQK